MAKPRTNPMTLAVENTLLASSQRGSTGSAAPRAAIKNGIIRTTRRGPGRRSARSHAAREDPPRLVKRTKAVVAKTRRIVLRWSMT
jgi:hypothetical protein